MTSRSKLKRIQEQYPCLDKANSLTPIYRLNVNRPEWQTQLQFMSYLQFMDDCSNTHLPAECRAMWDMGNEKL